MHRLLVGQPKAAPLHDVRPTIRTRIDLSSQQYEALREQNVAPVQPNDAPNLERVKSLPSSSVHNVCGRFHISRRRKNTLDEARLRENKRLMKEETTVHKTTMAREGEKRQQKIV